MVPDHRENDGSVSHRHQETGSITHQLRQLSSRGRWCSSVVAAMKRGRHRLLPAHLRGTSRRPTPPGKIPGGFFKARGPTSATRILVCPSSTVRCARSRRDFPGRSRSSRPSLVDDHDQTRPDVLAVTGASAALWRSPTVGGPVGVRVARERRVHRPSDLEQSRLRHRPRRRGTKGRHR